MEKPNYYSIIPAEVRYNNNLTANEKLLYSEITALTSATGECWATNEYFSRLYNVTIRSIQRMISDLKKEQLIDIKLITNPETKLVEKRIITLKGGDINVMRSRHKCLGGHDINVTYNNINNNNKSEYIYNTTPPKHKYGEYKNVLLTDEELEKLKINYNNWEDLITYLDEYIEMKGYKAKSHYLCIKKWVVDAVRQHTPKKEETDAERIERMNKILYDSFKEV
jgi:hypothetical protein